MLNMYVSYNGLHYILLTACQMDIDPTEPTSVPSSSHIELPPTSSGRQHTFPSRFSQSGMVLSSRTAVPHMPEPASAPSPKGAANSHPPVSNSFTRTSSPELNWTEFHTAPDEFGVFRVHPHKPTYDPDNIVDVNTPDGSRLSSPGPEVVVSEPVSQPYSLSGAFSNWFQFLLL